MNLFLLSDVKKVSFPSSKNSCVQSCDLWMFVKENPDRKEKIKENSFNSNWAIPEKNNHRGRGRGELEDMEVRGVYQRKSMWKFQGLITNEVELARVSKKIQSEISRSLGHWFLALEFPMYLIKICEIWRHQGWIFVFAWNFKNKGIQNKYVLYPLTPQPLFFVK